MTSDEIKEYVSMQDILNRYGLKTNRAGMMCCPFHKDKHPSMKIYPKDYHCFGCGAHGDVFSFVMQFEGISFSEAFQKLGGTYKHENVMEHSRRIRNEKNKERPQKQESFCGLSYADMMDKLEPGTEQWYICQYEAVKETQSKKNKKGG